MDCFGKAGRGSRTVLLLLAALLLSAAGAGRAVAAEGTNPVALENARPGTPGWELARPSLDHEVEGYASAASVAPGDTLRLHVSSSSSRFDIEVFRLGWYGGVGARRVFASRGLRGGLRPVPAPRAGDGLVACAWPVRARIPVGRSWTTGAYLVRLTGREDSLQSYVPFVVREGAGPRRGGRRARSAPLLVQLSVTTWQAYNNWGGKSLYDFNSGGGERALRVSFDRPYASSPAAAAGAGAGELLTVTHGPRAAGWEYPLIRWLERNGYDVAYATNLDIHAGREPARDRRAVLLVGHDEYWSRAMRDRLERARDRGVHLGVLSSNTGYWQIRLEPGRSGARDRVIFCSKDHTRDPVCDTARDADLTVRFRDLHPRRPEVALLGVMLSDEIVEGDFTPLPGALGHWVYEGTGFRESGAPPAAHLLGYEVDRTWASDSVYGRWSPPGLTVLARSHPANRRGEAVTAETAIHRAQSGAIVFAAGTNQWSWGLDDWGAPALRPAAAHPDIERVTRNVVEAFLREPAPPPSPRSPR